jgi:SAM-dependent methyltransferase
MLEQPEAHHAQRSEKENAADIIGDAEYSRLRLHPEPGHNFYLHLQDLRTALGELASHASGLLLDYGCGSSPYRSLFPNVDYQRADYSPSVGIDYAVREDQTIDARNESFDYVLSTQVLEHVRRPEAYLAECFRLLKAGGTLLLSTHGTFEEHGCPYDFRRWTADGLKEDITRAGFEMKDLKKLTTGPRAAGFLFHQYGGMLAPGRRSPLGLLHWFFFRRTTHFFAAMNRKLDRKFSDCGVVDASAPGHPLYIALLAVAIKPA